MSRVRRLRSGMATLALVALGASAVTPATPALAARAQPQSGSGTPVPNMSSVPNSVPLPANVGTPTGKRLNGSQPTPYPLVTLGPPGSASDLPYPAYGTPVPGVGVGTPAADVPAQITLQQAIAISFARSPALSIARGDVGIQAAAVRLQRAGLLPLFDASSSYTYSHEQAGATTVGTTTGTGTTTTATTARNSGTAAGFSAQLSQLIYDGGKISAAVNAAQRGEVASADTYRRDLQTVANNVAQAYYAYLSAQRTTQVDLEIVREDQVQEDLVRAQVRAGTSARADIATVQLPTAQARLAVVRSQGTQFAAEATFANAMGLDANANVQPVDDAPVFTNSQVSSIPIPTYDQALRRAVALRPDYDSSIQSVRQAEYSLKNARLGLFPTLSGTGTASDNSTDGTSGTFRNSQSVGLALSIPLYDQGVTAANTASARASLDVAHATLEQTTLGLQLSVKQALTNLVSARAALDQTQQEYATAVTNVQSTQAQYRAGVTTLPLLLNAQVQLTTALTDQVTAVYALREAEQSYLYSVGANYATTIGDAPLPAHATPNPLPSGSPPPVDPNATPLPVPTQSIPPLPSPTPEVTATPSSGVPSATSAASPAPVTGSPSPAPRRRGFRL